MFLVLIGNVMLKWKMNVITDNVINRFMWSQIEQVLNNSLWLNKNTVDCGIVIICLMKSFSLSPIILRGFHCYSSLLNKSVNKMERNKKADFCKTNFKADWVKLGLKFSSFLPSLFLSLQICIKYELVSFKLNHYFWTQKIFNCGSFITS